MRLLVLCGALGAFALSGCSSNDEPETATNDEATAGGETSGTSDPGTEATPTEDIVQIAQGAGQFNTLVSALQAAGLVETLQGPGPFTVFAPTDDAFAALPEGTLDNLLLPENREQLTAILTYHVVSGAVRAEQVVTMDSAETVQGASLTISAADGGVQIGNANVEQADIEASNGIIHVIDAVLLPPSE